MHLCDGHAAGSSERGRGKPRETVVITVEGKECQDQQNLYARLGSSALANLHGTDSWIELNSVENLAGCLR